jgi:hypothetical protein
MTQWIYSVSVIYLNIRIWAKLIAVSWTSCNGGWHSWAILWFSAFIRESRWSKLHKVSLLKLCSTIRFFEICPILLQIAQIINASWFPINWVLDQKILTNFVNYSYVFMGDYVDRGIYGVEVIILMIAIKVKFHYFINIDQLSRNIRNAQRQSWMQKHDRSLHIQVWSYW